MRFAPELEACSRTLRRCALLLALAALTGCAVAPPRTDDPLEKINRKTYTFNQKLDKTVIRPVAVGYRKVTNPTSRKLISNFFSNVRMPITIANDVLQVRPVDALKSTGRLVVNTTLGFAGLFDPASEMKLPLDPTDFGVTLAHWGVPEGPYIVVPFVGPSTLRDIWALPVDGYFFDPIGYFERYGDADWYVRYSPQWMYLVTLRSSFIDSESFLKSAYDPYVFERDAYRQHRLYLIYHGNPPDAAVEKLQGDSGNGSDDDIDQLLQQQHAYEKAHGIHSDGKPSTPPAGASSSGNPPPSSE